MKKNFQKFYVLIEDINARKIIPYDIMEYFMNCYYQSKKKKRYWKPTPTNFEEFKQFIIDESHYMFWSRTEWEIIISDWPPSGKVEEKWDVHQQIMMNIDVITKLLMENVVTNKKTSSKKSEEKVKNIQE